MKPYVVIEKKVGETPLQSAETYRATDIELKHVPMAYAGRLDPMASGKLLILQGDECKVQERYHNLDKEYEFEVLFGVGSDTGDVLGLLHMHDASGVTKSSIEKAVEKLVGEIELPYPHFSSKTVKGKPLHVWTLEGRIGEIQIPTKRSTIYKLKLMELRSVPAQDVYVYATEKIETILPVTELSKALGNDFRRADVRLAWETFMNAHEPKQPMLIARFSCICSSGTYMRTLASVIAKETGTLGLAYSIHRTKIGIYKKLFGIFGMWVKVFK